MRDAQTLSLAAAYLSAFMSIMFVLIPDLWAPPFPFAVFVSVPGLSDLSSACDMSVPILRLLVPIFVLSMSNMLVLELLALLSISGIFVAIPKLSVFLSVFDMIMLIPGLSALPFIFSISVPMFKLSDPPSMSDISMPMHKLLALLSMSGISMPISWLSAPLPLSIMPMLRPELFFLPLSTWSLLQIPIPVPKIQKLGQWNGIIKKTSLN